MTNWTEVNDKRIARFQKIIFDYCNHDLRDVTSLAINKARASLSSLLQNVIDRAPLYRNTPREVMNSMSNPFKIALCSNEQAFSIARSIVYSCIGDNIDLYPISAKDKIERALHNNLECQICKDEITVEDALYFIYTGMFSSKAPVGNYQKVSVLFLQDLGYTGVQPVILAWYFIEDRYCPVSSIPSYKTVPTMYDEALIPLVENRYLFSDGKGNFAINKDLL